MARAILSTRSYAGRHRAARTSPRALVTVAGATAAVGAVLAPSAAHADTVWDRVADCESSGNWAINTGNGYYGGLQFSSPTWLGFGGAKYAAYAHQASKPAQISRSAYPSPFRSPALETTSPARPPATVPVRRATPESASPNA